MCAAGRLRTARGSLDTVFCAFRLLARRLLWARGIQGLDEEHLVTPFLTRLRWTLARLSHCRFSGSAAVCRAKASIQPKGHSWGVCYRRVLHRQVNVTDFQITLKP